LRVGFYLEGDVTAVARIERAEHGELEVVHALVREVEPTSDSSDDERRDATEPRIRRNRQDDPVRHEPSRPAHTAWLSGEPLDSTEVATTDDFDVRVETMPGGAAVLRVLGDLDLATAPRLEAVITDVGASPRIVVDLSSCTFLDSAGVRVLMRAVGEPARRRVALVSADPGILRVLEITRVDTLLDVYPTVDAAL
jgi:anti-anti-sigma factor